MSQFDHQWQALVSPARQGARDDRDGTRMPRLVSPPAWWHNPAARTARRLGPRWNVSPCVDSWRRPPAAWRRWLSTTLAARYSAEILLRDADRGDVLNSPVVELRPDEQARWKLIVLLVGIFLAGAGERNLGDDAGVAPAAQPAACRRPSSGNVASLHLKRIMRTSSSVQPAQVEKIRPVVDRRMLELFNLRARYLDDNHALREVMEREVAEYMTPEQRAKYEKDEPRVLTSARAARVERGETWPPDRNGRPPDRFRARSDGDRTQPRAHLRDR